jgi:hypothetical protein
MDYKRIHDAIIERAKTRTLTGYKERHHIVPKCMGGTDDKSNLVELTAREHYIIHRILHELFPDNHGLLKGYVAMTRLRQDQRDIKITSREYEYLRIEFSIRNTGDLNPAKRPEVRKKISDSSMGHEAWNTGLTKETNASINQMASKLKKIKRWNAGLTKEDPRIQKQIQKSIETRTGKKRGKYNIQYETCTHCNITSTRSVITRQHGDKCKYKL